MQRRVGLAAWQPAAGDWWIDCMKARPGPRESRCLVYHKTTRVDRGAAMLTNDHTNIRSRLGIYTSTTDRKQARQQALPN